MDNASSVFSVRKTVRLGNRLYDLKPALIMAILNVTPDSFFEAEGHLAKADNIPAAAVDRAGKLLEGGAAIIDIGGMSSRPGAEIISAQVEMDRVIPVVEALAKAFPDCPLSIDTVRAEVAEAAAKAGAAMINDISAGSIDPALIPTVGRLGLPYVLMHMKGRPSYMQVQPDYEDVVVELYDFFTEKIQELRRHGVHEILLDPGFGFGKLQAHNYDLLNRLDTFNALGYPLLAGISRKSMIHKALGLKPEQALNGTTALHAVALQKGASILRVHDPAEAREVVKLIELVNA